MPGPSSWERLSQRRAMVTGPGGGAQAAPAASGLGALGSGGAAPGQYQPSILHPGGSYMSSPIFAASGRGGGTSLASQSAVGLAPGGPVIQGTPLTAAPHGGGGAPTTPLPPWNAPLPPPQITMSPTGPIVFSRPGLGQAYSHFVSAIDTDDELPLPRGGPLSDPRGRFVNPSPPLEPATPFHGVETPIGSCGCVGGSCACTTARPGTALFPLAAGVPVVGALQSSGLGWGSTLFDVGAEEPKVSKVQEAISTFVTANRLKDCGCEATIRKYDEIRTERSATYLAKEKNCFKNFLGPVYRLRLWLGLNIYNTEIREHKAEIHIHCPPGPGCPLVDQTIVVSLDETKGSPVFEKTVWTTLRTIRGVQEEELRRVQLSGWGAVRGCSAQGISCGK